MNIMIISFFQNNMTDLVKDCTAALELNPKYTKALSRRAKAFQNLGQLSECLEDITALCILEGFSNPRSLETADTVLKDLGRPSTLCFYDFSSQNEVFVKQAKLWRTLTTSLLQTSICKLRSAFSAFSKCFVCSFVCKR